MELILNQNKLEKTSIENFSCDRYPNVIHFIPLGRFDKIEDICERTYFDLLGFGIYKWIEWTDLDINWGTVFESRHYIVALDSALRLRKNHPHIKTFR